MASFSVDITKVVFAAANTGYKDITITNMPSAGVNCSITSGSSYFGYRIPDPNEPNVIRAYTSGTNTASGSALRSGVLRIENYADSSDYVTISLKQLRNNYVGTISSTSSCAGTIYDVITDNPTMINVNRDESKGDYYGMLYNLVYFNYNKGDYSTAKCTVLLDGSAWTIPTSSNYPSWISITSDTTYTDTGFKKVYISVVNNYDGPRETTLSFGSSSYGDWTKLYVRQDGYPSSTSGSTEKLTFPKTGGTLRATLNHISLASSDLFVNTDGLYTVFSGYNVSSEVSGSNTTYYDVTLASNTSDQDKESFIYYWYSRTSSSFPYLGHTTIVQEGQAGPTPTLSVDPSTLAYPSTSGARVLSVTYASPLTTNESSFPSWLTASYVNVDVSTRSYTINAAANETSIARSFDFELADANMSLTVPITQAAGSPASLSISPTADTVSNSNGTVQITVTSSGISEVSYSISDTSWISYSGKSGNVYTFYYSANSGTSQRQGTITFSGGGLSRTFTLTQAGQAATLIVSPASDTVGSSSGSVQVTVSGNVSAVSYSISDTSWLHYVSVNNGVYTFSYDTNTGSQRIGTVTFSGGGLSRTFTLTQAAGSVASLSISPSSTVFGYTNDNVNVNVYNAVGNITTAVSGSWLSVGSPTVSGSYTIYPVNVTSNSSNFPRYGGVVTFADDRNVPVTFTANQYTSRSDVQIEASPRQFYVSSSGDTVNVNFTGFVNIVNYTSGPDWVHPDTYPYASGNSLIWPMTIDPNNTGSYREENVWFGDRYTGYGILVKQPSGAVLPSLTVSPSSVSVSKNSGQVSTTVTVNNPTSGSVSCSISGSWLTASTQSGNTYYFNYSANTDQGPRTATVTFSYPGASNVTFTVYQAGTAPVVSASLVAYPKRLVFHCESSSINVWFKKFPTAGVSYSTTYTDGSGWLSVTPSGDVMRVTASNNTGSRRRATIRFYETGNSSNYVDVPVIQGSTDYYTSIWVDQEYYPSDWEQTQMYYSYKLTNNTHNNQGDMVIYRGIAAKAPGHSGDQVGCIDIPRIIEDRLYSDFWQRANNTWYVMDGGYRTVGFYNMNVTPNVLVDTFKYWNDWSRCVDRYDYTRYLNDPINDKGCQNMVIPICVYYDDAATFSIVDTATSGMVDNYILPTPEYPFVMMYHSFYGSDRVDYKQGNDIVFSYDLRHCGNGALIYRNRFGGYDSFLIEGNIIKTDNYTKLNYEHKGFYNVAINNYHYASEKYTDTVNINTTYECHTGWLTDEESERLAFHLLSSPEVYFQDLDFERFDYNIRPVTLDKVRLTNSNAEYKKFRNGRKLVKYTITFEMCDIQKVRN